MTEPERVAKPTPAKPVAKPVDKSPARKPTTGAEIKTGDARVKTGGAAIPFGGLAAQAAAARTASGSTCRTSAAPSTCRRWCSESGSPGTQNQGAAGTRSVKFTIRRDGMLTQVEVEKPSGQAMLDLESRRAVLHDEAAAAAAARVHRTAPDGSPRTSTTNDDAAHTVL